MSDRPPPVFQKPAGLYEPRGRLDPEGYERHVRFQVRPPPADLAPFLEHFWLVRWDSSRGHFDSQEVMHRPFVDVFLSSQESGIQGTFRGKRTYSAAGSGRILGMRFRPGAFHAFHRGPMADLQDKVVALTQVFPWADAACIERVLGQEDEQAVLMLIGLMRRDLPAPDLAIELVNEIIDAVEEEDLDSVAAVAEAFGRSERWLQQTFRDYLGINLKWLLQRHRLLKAAEHIRNTAEPDWAALAHALGYSSQQHFITDFKSVVGSTPVRYKAGLE